jgi:small subunit ribosomal protein S17
VVASEPAAVNRKTRVGTVVSDKMEQTLVVVIGRTTRHPLYRKVIRRTKKYHVHDPEGRGTLGDLVRIEECRPISKTKRWQLVEVLTERAVADVAAEEIDSSLVDEMQRSAAHREQEEAAAAEAAAPATEAAGAPAAHVEVAADAEGAAEATPATDEQAAAPDEDAPAVDAPADDAPAVDAPATDEETK